MINQTNNAELERRGPVSVDQLKDVDLVEELNKRKRKVVAAAKQLRIAAQELEDFAGPSHRFGAFSLADIQVISQGVETSPEASACLATQILFPTSRRGRRPKTWHVAAREIAPLIQNAMRAVGYSRKRLRWTTRKA